MGVRLQNEPQSYMQNCIWVESLNIGNTSFHQHWVEGLQGISQRYAMYAQQAFVYGTQDATMCRSLQGLQGRPSWPILVETLENESSSVCRTIQDSYGSYHKLWPQDQVAASPCGGALYGSMTPTDASHAVSSRTALLGVTWLCASSMPNTGLVLREAR